MVPAPETAHKPTTRYVLAVDERSPSSLYAEPAYYRMLFRERTQDVSFYRELARRVGGPILELGIGDGRVAFPLAEDGHEIVGVDLSATMLEGLEARRAELPHEVSARVTASIGDARVLRLGRRFALVLCPFNGFAHQLDAADQRAFFDTVKAHLEPGGTFAFDVLIPDPAQSAGGSSAVPRFEHPRTGKICRLEEHASYDSAAEILTLTTTLVERETGARQELELALKQLHPQPTLRLLEAHEWTIVERTGVIGDSLAYVCQLD